MNRFRSSTCVLFAIAAGLAATILSCRCPPPVNTGPSLALPRRLAARSKTPDCPAPLVQSGDHWEVESLFGGRDGAGAPAFLRGHCVYRWVGAGSPDVRSLPADKLHSISEDPPVVVALAGLSPVEASVLKDQRKQLAMQVLPTASGAHPGFPASYSSSKPVFIGFPDSSPSNGRPGSALIPVSGSAHGFNVAWLTRWLTCQKDTCLSAPLTELAFDSTDVLEGSREIAPGTGLSHGSRTAFAAAIVRLVDRWKTDGAGQDLVINIAAGWEPAYECLPSLFTLDDGAPAKAKEGDGADVAQDQGKQGELDEKKKGGLPKKTLFPGAKLAHPVAECNPQMVISEPAQAVYEALVYASCNGALIIAAAGNDPGYSPPLRGPMYPAALERTAALSQAECQGLGEGMEKSIGGEGPLVHAAAGVNPADLPILVSREDSRSRLAVPAHLLVAYPDHASNAGYGQNTCTTSPCAPSVAMTGTSVAASITSAIAAAVWAVQPDWSAKQVIDTVHASGVVLKEKRAGAEVPIIADYCLGACEEVHRISMCSAIAAACAAPGASSACSQKLSDCVERIAYGGEPVPPADVDRGLGARDPVVPGSTFLAVPYGVVMGQPVASCPPCGTEILNPAQDRVYGDIPQSFFAEAREDYLESPVLRFFDRSNNLIESHPSGPESWSARRWSSTDPSLAVDLFYDYRHTAPPVSATLSFTGSSGRIYTQVIPITSP